MKAEAIAHGIRNPLASIQFQVEWLRDQTDPLDDRRSAIDQALEEIERIAAAVEAILDHSSPPPPRPQTFDLAHVLGEATRRLLPKAERRHQRLVREGLDREIPVRTDPALLSKSVVRLLENAIDASEEGGEAQIFCDCTEEGVAVTIVDHGGGMGPEELGRLGEAYFSRKAKGLGLGVHLAKRDLERIGAELSFRSQPARGTTVSIHLKDIRSKDKEGEG